LVDMAAEMIQPNFEQIWRHSHSRCETQVGWRSDHPDGTRRWRPLFDRLARCHILNDSGNYRPATTRPFVACSREDRN
jgi:hypothetical protein